MQPSHPPSLSSSPVTAGPRSFLVVTLCIMLVAAGAGVASAVPGVLTQLDDPDACVSTGNGDCTGVKALQTPNSIAASPDSKFVYVAAMGSDAVAVFSRDTTTGALTQLDDKAGCVSGSLTVCTPAQALIQPVAVAVTPDGNFLYATTQGSNSITVFKRNKITGVLTQVAGCVSEDGSSGACATGKALVKPYAIVVSPDNKHVYVASLDSYAVAAFSRDKITGALTQLSGKNGCVSEDGTSGQCVDGYALREARTIAISPDGKHVYVGSQSSNAVAAFARNKITGVLTQLPGNSGQDGCVSETGTGGTCAQGSGLVGPVGIAVSLDNKSVYVTSLGTSANGNTDAAVAIFSRNRTTGVLTQLGCVGNDNDGCDAGIGLTGARGVAISHDRKTVYVVAQTGNAVAVFSRNLTTGALTQLSGTTACVSEDGTGGSCVVGVGLTGARAVAVTADGKSVYVGSFQDNAVAEFSRATR